MDADGSNHRNGESEGAEVSQERLTSAVVVRPPAVDLEAFRQFFHLAGGSVFYCVSAVLVAYGSVKVLGPVLAGTETIHAALPCIITLAVYELALLGVLLLIVWRKVVDDAISVALILALYMVATSMALGSVVERDPAWAVLPAAIGTVLGMVKFVSMRRFIRIPFGVLSVVGLSGLIAANYFGPILLARSIQADPADELGRRGLWFLVWLTMLVSVGLVWVEGLRGERKTLAREEKGPAFLQSPLMVYVLAMVLLVASSVHQYATAYMFVLDRPAGDFLGPIALGAFLALEMLRYMKLRFGVLHLVVACVPLGALGFALYNELIVSQGRMAWDIMVWPPVFCALVAIGLAVVAMCHRWWPLLVVVFAYLLGTMLTAGYSPQQPQVLHVAACGSVLVVGLLLYGLIARRPELCLMAIVVAVAGLANAESFLKEATRWQLTGLGVLAGVMGVGCTVLAIVFADRLHYGIRLFGTVCLAGFLFDVLPDSVTARYGVALLAVVVIALLWWFRTRDWLGIFVLFVPLAIRTYMLARRIAYWRVVVLGFVVLALGAVVSLAKSAARSRSEVVQ